MSRMGSVVPSVQRGSQSGNAATIKRAAVRESGMSGHHERPIEVPLENPLNITAL